MQSESRARKSDDVHARRKNLSRHHCRIDPRRSRLRRARDGDAVIGEPEILRIPWRKLPLLFRQRWWQATDYGRELPAPEFIATMPELLTTAQLFEDDRQARFAAELAAGREVLRQAHQPPCEQCLRSPPCQQRCLRSMLRLHQRQQAQRPNRNRNRNHPPLQRTIALHRSALACRCSVASAHEAGSRRWHQP